MHVSHPWINPGAIEQRDYQERIVGTAISGNTLVCIPTGLGKCHAYDDFIITDSGDIHPIGDVVESALKSHGAVGIDDGYIIADNPDGLKILSWTEEGIKPCKVLGFSKRVAEETIKIRTASGTEVTVTPEHPLLTLGKDIEWVAASMLKEGSSIAIPRKIQISQSPQTINFFGVFENAPGKAAMVRLKTGEVVKIKKFRKLGMKEEDAEGVFYTGGRSLNHVLKPITEVSRDIARFIALVTAEGGIYGNVKFYSDDPIILEDFANLSRKLFSIEPLEIEGGLVLKSTALVYFLRSAFGVNSSHSGEKTVPSLILKSPDDVVGSYLGGLYDGEGSVREDDMIELMTASKYLAYKIPYLLRRFGIVCRVKKKMSMATNSPNPKKRIYYRIYIEGRDDLETFHKFISFMHPGRKEKLEKILNSRSISNSNVDTFPVADIVKDLRKSLNMVTSREKDFRGMSDFGLYERGQRKPPRRALTKIYKDFLERYDDVAGLEPRIERLRHARDVMKNYGEILKRISPEEKGDILPLSSRKQIRNWISGKWRPKIKKNSPFMRLMKSAGYDVDPETIREDMKIMLKTLRITPKWLRSRNIFMLYANPQKLERFISEVIEEWERMKKSLKHIEIINKLLNSDIKFDNIVSIEKTKKKQWVYDLCTENGNFIAGDYGCLISHNTNIAAMVAAHRLSKNMDGKILFLAPTRPLVEQHMKSFGRMLKVEEERMSVVTGETPPGERHGVYRKSDMIFSTPQCIRNDLKAGIIFLQDFVLCIFDEAHRAVGNYAYPYVAKVYMSQSKDPLILGLTASPGSHRYKIDEVRGKLYIKNVEIRTREDRDVARYVQEMKQDFVEVELTVPMQSVRKYLETVKNERIKKLVGWKVLNSFRITKTEILRKQHELAKSGVGWKYAAISVLAEVLKVDHALALLETQCMYALKSYFDKMRQDAEEGKSKAVVKLMKDDNFSNAMRLTDELFAEGHEHPKMEKLKEIVAEQLEKDKFSLIIVFAQFRDTVNRIHETLGKIPKVSPVEFIGQAKKKGRGLSQKEQVQILNEFKMGFYNVLCASQVAEEGLDIAETSLVVFYEPTPSAIRKIQRSGRTARTEKGRVVVLIAKDTRDEAYHWSAHQKEKKMTKILYEMRDKNLRNFT